jgi:hypothetical protein
MVIARLRFRAMDLKERAMMQTGEMGRLCMHAASNVVGTIADHNLKNMKLSIDNTLRSLEYAAQLAGAKTGAEVMEFSSAHYLEQLNVLRCCFENLADLVCKTTTGAAKPFRSHAVVSSCVIL